jgi:1-acyl-sn-glycerol-3-phosphate acyltransferase
MIMVKFILSIYEYFSKHRFLLFGLLAVLISLFVFAASHINFKEDISAFLPKDNNTERINYAYQHLSATNKLLVNVSMADTTAMPDEELIIAAVSHLVEQLQQSDSNKLYFKKIDYKVDQQQMLALSQFLVENMPYFLTEPDYRRIDSLLTEENIRQQMSNNKRMLISPIGMVMKQNIMADPLHFSAPVLMGLRDFQVSDQFQLYNDFIFSSDRKEGIITIESRYPISETQKNAEILKIIDRAASNTQSCFEQKIKIHHFGSIAIAVTNANRIKQDALLSSIISILLILSILIYAFRSTKSLLLMLFSLLFGWLFAIGLISVLRSDVSIIAIGISSIIIGIAVNYPLHIIMNHKHEPHIPNVIRNIVIPLTIGNITTVGAFLSLLFINGDAMKDLGLFAALLLAGTICFVLIFLPHLLRKNTKANVKFDEKELTFGKLLSWKPKRNKWFIWIFLALSITFCIFSFNTKFDTDMQNINFMTETQKSSFQKLISTLEQGQQTIYFASMGENLDEALTAYEDSKAELDSLQLVGTLSKVSGLGIYLPSKEMQQQRLERWRMFCEEKKDILAKLDKIGIENGFKSGAFNHFYNIINNNYELQNTDYFEPIISLLANNYIVNKENGSMVMTILHTMHAELDALGANLNSINDKSFSFDAGTMGRSMVNSLSGDFDKVLFICGFIVFVFLLFTLGRLELTLLAFLPLTIAWFWILGIMSIFDINFNIVNIILAAFIFGQGDDYTIFMAEGLMYEYTYRRKLLISYKNTITLSSIVMFIGIGSLILAQHPALRSLAEITIIGMGSVVLMAFLLPPVIFRWLTLKKGERRLMPITLANLTASIYAFTMFLIGSLIAAIVWFPLVVFDKTDKKKLRFHRLISCLARFVVLRIPRVKTRYNNYDKTIFDKPAVIICNHQSHIDLVCVMSLTPKLVILTNDWVWNSPYYGRLIKYADFYPVSNGIENAMDKLQAIVGKGYSVMIFPEGTRSEDCSIQRFHRGAFYLAEQLKLDIIPVVIHGVGHLLPKKEFMLRKGKIHINVMPRIACNAMGETYAESAKSMRKFYKKTYSKIAAEVETADYYSDLVLHNYIYKGPSIERAVRRNLKKHQNYQDIISQLKNKNRVLIVNCGYGELPLLLSLVHKDLSIVATDTDIDKLELAANCTWVKEHLKYVETVCQDEKFDAVVLVNPNDEQRTRWENTGAELHILVT